MTFELFTLTRPDSPSRPWFLSLIPYLPYQTIQIAHTATITFFIALARLGPVLPSPSASPTTNDSPSALPAGYAALAGDGTEAQQTDRLLTVLEARLLNANVETSRQLAMDLIPFRAADAVAESPALSASLPVVPPGGRGSMRTAGTTGPDEGPAVQRVREALGRWLATHVLRNDEGVKKVVERAVARRRGAAAGDISLDGDGEGQT